MRWPGANPVVSEAVTGIGIGVGTMVVLAGIELTLTGNLLELPGPLRQLVATQNGLLLAVTCVLAVAVVPCAEELFYRGLVHGSMRRWSVPGAIVIQAFLFALAHQYDFTYSVFVFIGGALFGIVYEWRRTLLAPIFMHLTCNLMTVAFLVISFVAYGNRPTLGVAWKNYDDDRRITRVIPGSSAEEAGLKPGDIVVSLDDRSISRPGEIITAVQHTELGGQLKLGINRSGKLMTLTVKLNHRIADRNDQD